MGGQLEISKYSSSVWGETPGPHKTAAIRITLARNDSVWENYKGKGEVFIVGELKPRILKIYAVRLGHNGALTGNWDSEPRSAEHLDGHLEANSLTFNEDGWGLKFRGVMHRGSDADYETILRSKMAGMHDMTGR